MAKVTAITKMVSKPGKFDELMSVADKLVAAVQGEDGTEIYAVSRATKAADTLFIFEMFTDRDAFKQHAAAGAAVGGLLQPLVAEVDIVLGEPLVAKGLPI